MPRVLLGWKGDPYSKFPSQLTKPAQLYVPCNSLSLGGRRVSNFHADFPMRWFSGSKEAMSNLKMGECFHFSMKYGRIVTLVGPPHRWRGRSSGWMYEEVSSEMKRDTARWERRWPAHRCWSCMWGIMPEDWTHDGLLTFRCLRFSCRALESGCDLWNKSCRL